MSLIIDTILNYLPAKRKTTLSGWTSFNAVCCDDKKQRGGLIINGGEAVSYHCFNCQFKCSWQPGRTLSQKMTKFMRELGMSDDVISKLRLEALRLDPNESVEIRSIIPKFEVRALPIDAEPIASFIDNPPSKLMPVLEYMYNRKLFLEDYNFYWTPKLGFNNRLIIPFYKDGIVVGYTARAVNDSKPKYISEQQPGYVFNLDRQTYDRTFAFVMEGPVDAISIDGTALMGSEIKDSQAWLLKQLGKEIVLIPDRDKEGAKTVEAAIELGWSVSMPEWPDGVKDVNEALVKLGRLATLWLILDAKESYVLKIQLRAKKWFPKEKDDNTD